MGSNPTLSVAVRDIINIPSRTAPMQIILLSLMIHFLDDPVASARFWSKVEKTDTCWLWRGAKSGLGYGRVKIKGKLYSPHALSYAWHNRDDPKGFDVCHHCDTPACVNPAHLFKGSRSLNVRDCIRKGRHVKPTVYARGERINHAKLTEAKVQVIRKRIQHGDKPSAIARDFLVDESAIRQIRDGKTWKHVQ